MDRNTTRFATLVALFVVSAASRTAKAAEPCDDPYLAVVLDARPAIAILHRPAVAPRVHRTRFQLGASLGYTAMTGFTRLSAPTIEAVAALRFGGGVSEHLGLRLSAFAAAPIKSSSHDGYGTSEDDARAYGAALALQITWNNGFWLAPGLGVLRYRGPLAFMMCDASGFGEGGGCGSDELTVPELTLGIGWEISLSRNVALQLAGQAGTAIFTLRGSLYAGLSILL